MKYIWDCVKWQKIFFAQTCWNQSRLLSVWLKILNIMYRIFFKLILYIIKDIVPAQQKIFLTITKSTNYSVIFPKYFLSYHYLGNYFLSTRLTGCTTFSTSGPHRLWIVTTAIQNHRRGCRRVSNFCMGS